mmetsp:Transcript_32866/g.75682  ORF Transcript_32866/g.75682 Transcript_32866/m.75682 type:complete len:80 (+) Transcript_32866:1009-1248(+)
MIILEMGTGHDETARNLVETCRGGSLVADSQLREMMVCSIRHIFHNIDLPAPKHYLAEPESGETKENYSIGMEKHSTSA